MIDNEKGSIEGGPVQSDTGPMAASSATSGNPNNLDSPSGPRWTEIPSWYHRQALNND